MTNMNDHYRKIAARLEAEATAKLAAANEMNELIARLEILSGNDNADDLPPTVPPAVAATVKVKVVPIVADDRFDEVDKALIAALTNEFQGVGQIFGRIPSPTFSKGTAYGRLPKLAINAPDIVEQHGEAKRWKLKANATKPAGDQPVDKPAKGKAAKSKAMAKAPARAMSMMADNDRGGLADGLHHGDCFELFKHIQSGSIPLVLVDPPYGTTNSKIDGKPIDIKLDMKAFMDECARVVTPTGNIVMFASQPFTNELMNAASEYDIFKYDMAWMKDKPTGFPHARNRLMKDHEDILLFSHGAVAHEGRSSRRATFNPWSASKVMKKNNPNRNKNAAYLGHLSVYEGEEYYEGLVDCARTVFEYMKERGCIHPFQKPLALLDDLIRHFSNEGDLVLDACAGSGATLIAALNAGRRAIGFEKHETCFNKAINRINEMTKDIAA